MNQQVKIEAGTPHVYQAIADVQGELAKTGIAKNRQASGGGANYSFRGIDDVYAALSPLLAQHKLCVIPRVLERVVEQRTTKNGGALFNVTVRAEFDFVSAIDGTTHTAATFGEAMDSSDKATNKAMSAAYKYAAFMTFAIPTEGDNDADATIHEEAVKVAQITDEQYAMVDALLKATNVPLAKVLNTAGVKRLLDMTEEQATALIASLNGILAKRSAANQQSAPVPTPQADPVLADEIPY